MTWLLTGGAGYIGAHIVDAFVNSGLEIAVFDNLSSGVAGNIPAHVAHINADITNPDALKTAMREHKVTGVVHLAAKKSVEESVADPIKYFHNNVFGTQCVLEAMLECDVKNLLFSSSAATYGNVTQSLVSELSTTNPESPYGATKLIGEQMITSVATAHGLNAISLRYFNAAGAGRPEFGDRGVANLVPMVFRALENGANPRVFGTDYPTPDGSCVRDYVHVCDLGDAHARAAQALENASSMGTNTIYNVGTGVGTSVIEIINAVRAISGRKFDVDYVPRRPGDPATVVASCEKIRLELGFQSKLELNEIVESAWKAWRHLNP